MVTSIKIPITSSELGTLWTTYEREKMMKVLINHFYDKSENKESKKIKTTLNFITHGAK